MQSLGQFLQTGDFKNEKHVPVIHLPEKIREGGEIEIKVSIGDDIKHPNTLDHHIVWIKLYYFSEEGKFPVEIADFNFSSHGEGGVFTEPVGLTHVILHKPGFIYAMAYCNIHGLWEHREEVKFN